MSKEELIQKLYQSSIDMVVGVQNLAKDYDLTDSQDYINWLDELNNLTY